MTSVEDLTEKELDFAVGLANGWKHYPEDSIEQGDTWHLNGKVFGPVMRRRGYTPSTNWAQAGSIIERERITFWYSALDCCFYARMQGSTTFCQGQKPLIAAMRCYVSVKLGDLSEIEFPKD